MILPTAHAYKYLLIFIRYIYSALAVTNPNKEKFKGKKKLQHIITTITAYHNSIDVTTFDDYILRIDCNKAEKGLKTKAWIDHVLNAMGIDNFLEYQDFI